MATKYTGLVVRLLAASLLFNTLNCGKKCTETTYSFNLPVKAYIDKDSIKIGDTIWLEINEPVVLRNSDGSMVNYSGAENLGSAIAFGVYNSSINSWQNENPNSFILLLSDDRGRIINQNNINIEYGFLEKDGRYLFKLAVIPKKIGKFSILFSNSNNTFRSNDKCTKANFIIQFENTNQHYPLNPFYVPGTNPKGGDYYFVVK